MTVELTTKEAMAIELGAMVDPQTREIRVFIMPPDFASGEDAITVDGSRYTPAGAVETPCSCEDEGCSEVVSGVAWLIDR